MLNFTYDTPCVLVLTKDQLNALYDIVCAPTCLSGEEVLERSALITTLKEAVTIDLYNSCIVSSYEAAKDLKVAASDALNKVKVDEGQNHRPVAANRAENFLPPSRENKHSW